MAELDHNLLIISDLHLSEGFRPIEGSLSPNEDFLCDEGFADFLRFHNECREQLGRPWRLIIAGDLFDFLQVTSHSATDAKELKKKIDNLKKQPILARSVYAPDERRTQAIKWLDKAIGCLKEASPADIDSVIDCAKDLKAWAPQAEDILVWDLERLALETLILAFKPKAKSQKKNDKPKAELSEHDVKYGLGTSWPETIWKLDRIAEGHSVFFGALAWFLDRGNSLVIVKGNHDVELHWENVQVRVRDLLADSYVQLGQAVPWWTSRPMEPTRDAMVFRGEVETQCSFCPWIYFEPGLLYLEHGNQYEVLNAFPDFLNPVLQGRDQLIQLPPGSFFCRYFFNEVEKVESFADNLRPVTRFIAWAFKNRLVKVVELLAKCGGGLRTFVEEAIGRSLEDRKLQKKMKSNGHQTTAHTMAQGLLTSDYLPEIEDLALEERNASILSQVLIIAVPVMVFILILAGLLTIFVAPVVLASGILEIANSFLGNYFIGLIITVAAVFGTRYLFGLFVSWLTRVRDYLRRSAQKVCEFLESNGASEALRVRYFVFGHTHEPSIHRLGKEKNAPWYVNTGSWVYTINEVDAWDRLDRDFTFLQIIPDEEPEVEIPRLLRWNEAAGRPERIRRRLPDD
jgi:UDP-2,3-diacylglucosamine pyrophosphatase LpxH